MSVRESTGLTTINQYLRRQRLSIFGHIARLDPAVPANAALRLAVDIKEGRRPDPSWSRRPGRPRHTWAEQVREDAWIPLSTLWSAEVAKGHGAARRSSTRRQWWWWWYKIWRLALRPFRRYDSACRKWKWVTLITPCLWVIRHPKARIWYNLPVCKIGRF